MAAKQNTRRTREGAPCCWEGCILDAASFAQGLERTNAGNKRAGIGTLGEKRLHAVLKYAVEPREINHEIKIGPYVADIVGEEGIVEIQTRSFNALRKKLSAFLQVAAVTVVYPIPACKWLLWIDPVTGETTKKRKSPKGGTYYHAFYELYKIKPLLTHPNLRIQLVRLDMEEYRMLDGWSRDHKRGSTRYERIPTAFVDELWLGCPSDYTALIPQGLPAQFTSKDYGLHAALAGHHAQTALNVLHHVGAVERMAKQGRYHLYQRGQGAR